MIAQNFLNGDSLAGQDHLTVHIRGVDVLFFKYDRDSPAFQHTGVLDAVKGIPGEPRDGLGKNEVDFLFPAQLYHLVELLPFLGAYPGDALVRKNPDQLSAVVAGDLVGVVIHLHLKTVLLFFFLGTDPAVGCYSQLLFSLS
jgi:hypothetical protein